MNIFKPLWPLRGDPAVLNPPHLFAHYENAIHDMERAAATADDAKLLAQSWKMFDNESSRRSSIDTRAGAVMPAISLAATLVTGVGFSVLKDATIPANARWMILATYLLALAYLVRTMVVLFVIHGRVFRYTLDPSDVPTLAPAIPPALSPYDRSLACKIMRYTTENYQINNVQMDALVVAQRTFRNAILAITIGGTIAGLLIFFHGMTPPIIFDDLPE